MSLCVYVSMLDHTLPSATPQPLSLLYHSISPASSFTIVLTLSPGKTTLSCCLTPFLTHSRAGHTTEQEGTSELKQERDSRSWLVSWIRPWIGWWGRSGFSPTTAAVTIEEERSCVTTTITYSRLSLFTNGIHAAGADRRIRKGQQVMLINDVIIDLLDRQ